ncbi:MAG: MBL fold metallo-hydrolase [Gammaproteobacteria bacterium]|nr:MBL fold metallo-hydrolase [Gammaproteobacteria bacterium]
MKKIVFFTIGLIFANFSFASESSKPYLYILGVAQDAGYPQAGCYQPHCMPGWQNKNLRRTATSIALIDPANKKSYLFEATPNLPEQMYQLEQEAPSKQYPLSGIFLTHAHIGHYAGLMFLGHEAMGANQIPVYAMPRMKYYLLKNGPWSQLVSFKNIILKSLKDNTSINLNEIKVTPFLVPHRDEYSETVGYKIEGPNKSAIFIPDINKWSVWKTDLAKLIQQVDYALLDATFYADGELPGRDMSKIPHPFVSETMTLLKDLPAKDKNKIWFIHFNHTNPLLNTDSEQAKTVKANGFNVAKEGVRLEL